MNKDIIHLVFFFLHWNSSLFVEIYKKFLTVEQNVVGMLVLDVVWIISIVLLKGNHILAWVNEKLEGANIP